MKNPTDDLPSCSSEACDIGGCFEPWAGEVDTANGPRKLRLCEGHHDEWRRAEDELAAERAAVAQRLRKARREELAGRASAAKEAHIPPLSYAPLYGIVGAFDVRRRRAS